MGRVKTDARLTLYLDRERSPSCIRTAIVGPLILSLLADNVFGVQSQSVTERVTVKSLRMLLPLLTDVLEGGQALERFEAFGKVVGQQECGADAARPWRAPPAGVCGGTRMRAACPPRVTTL